MKDSKKDYVKVLGEIIAVVFITCLVACICGSVIALTAAFFRLIF